MTTCRVRWPSPLVFLLLAASCASHPSSTNEAYFEVHSTSPATRPLSAAELWPSRRGDQRYLLIENGAPIGYVRHHQESTDRYQAHWKLVEGDVREQFYSLDPEGHIDLHAVIEHKDRALSLFSPPLRSTYARLEPDDPRIQETDMRVVHSGNPQHVRETGVARMTIVYRENCRIRLGDREFETSRLDITFEADLRLANVRQFTTLYIVPGFGMVVEETRKTVQILGVFSSTERQLKVIAPETASTSSELIESIPGEDS